MEELSKRCEKLQLVEHEVEQVDLDVEEELTGIKELKKDNRVGAGFSNIDQPEVLGAGVKEKAVRTQIQSPGSIADSAGPYGLAKEQNEA
nr:hypothetical protein CFP56_01844 [Quercus suber]